MTTTYNTYAFGYSEELPARKVCYLCSPKDTPSATSLNTQDLLTPIDENATVTNFYEMIK